MRLLHLFLAIYALLLATLPCQDLPAWTDTDLDKPVVAASHDHSHPQELIDLCSPFCTCACCAGTALTRPGRLPDVTAGAINFYLPAFSYQFNSGRLAGRIVWQPPRRLV